MQNFDREYGVASEVAVVLLDANGELVDGITLATGDVTVTIDSGAPANIATLPSTFRQGRLIVALSAAELTGAQILIEIEDVGGTDFVRETVLIETYGHASAQHSADGADLTSIPWNSDWDVEVESEVTDALNTYDPPTNAEMVARTLASASYATAANQTTIANAIAALNNLSSAQVEAAVTAMLDAQGLTAANVLVMLLSGLLGGANWTRTGDVITLSNGYTITVTEDAEGRITSYTVAAP